MEGKDDRTLSDAFVSDLAQSSISHHNYVTSSTPHEEGKLLPFNIRCIQHLNCCLKQAKEYQAKDILLGAWCCSKPCPREVHNKLKYISQ